MNRSRYLTRRLDHIDRAIIAALYEDGRRTIKDVAELLKMSSPSITARIDKLKDAGAITGYTVVVDTGAFGLKVAAYVRMNAMPGQVPKLEKLIADAPEVVELHQITGEGCFLARVVVCDVHELKVVVDRFQTCSTADTAIILSSPVPRRLPKL
ncbi:MAG: Lrp/AsnC family transcriptional regulator [Erythrobacter sp.]|jgi:Lrp/AsnC family leucine-responsive transcriptional regulator|nr:Lrp/AsnC family transcriptional regulator [Erythrobacter sp.]